ncbi:MAG: peptidylprolyl isomerase [Bacteriovorax sp. MedPE-SWde]|nr:MAG: peptidylprolyl isomerase [Bacteriovorax sp. MedPE-SWde]
MSKKVIGFHYTLKDGQGTTIDSSEGATPLLFLQESGMIIPGLEKELITMAIGDKKNIEVKAADAYGEKRDDMIITVKKDQFPEGTEVAAGDQFRVNQDANMPPFTVLSVEGEEVTLDGNHPLAGLDLFFDVEITENRDATEEEVAHGHAHGEGGHHH